MIALLAHAFVKATVILLAAGAATLLLRRASAALRHLVWALACAGVLVLPVGSAVLPAWDVAAWPALPVPSAASFTATRLPLDPPASAAVVADTRWSPRSSGRAAAVAAGAPGGERRRLAPDWAALVVPAWLAGAVLVLAALAFGLARLAWLRRTAARVRDEAWLSLAHDLAGDVGVTRPVTLLRAAGPAMPMTWGLRHPVILLPADADGWPAARRRDVLLHELAHVARGDFLTQLLARLACAVYWFHPLVWLAAARLRVERERACDDEVLRAGARPSEYAGHLLEIARALRPAPQTSLASVAMARPAQLATRLLDVLDAQRCRDAVSARRAAPAWAAALAVVVPLAAAAPGSSSSPPPPPPASAVWSEPRAVPVAPAAPSDSLRGCSGGTRRGVSSSHRADDDVQTIMVTVGTCTVTLNAEGDFTFTEDFTDFAGVDGFVTFVVDYGRTDRRLTIQRAGTELQRVYKVNGDTRPFDAEAKAWLGEALTYLLRRTGYVARERGRWILQSRGIQGLLDEIALLGGDYARRRYYEVALASGRMDAAAFERLVEDAGRTIHSDYELAELLIAVAQGQPLTERMQAGFVAAAKTLSSDYERRRVLQTALTAPGLSPAVQTGMLDAAAGMKSDFELAELLIQLHTVRPIDEAVRPAFFRAANSLQSDYEHRRVLSTVIGRGRRPGLSRSMLLDVLSSARNIASDYELAELLTDVATAVPLDDTLRAAFFAAAKTLNSDYEHGRTLIGVAEGDNLSSATALAVVESARTLSSDHQRAEVLLTLIRNARIDAPLRDAIEASVRPMRSQHDRGRVLDALSRRAGRAELE